jgi:hypothetical protein
MARAVIALARPSRARVMRPFSLARRHRCHSSLGWAGLPDLGPGQRNARGNALARLRCSRTHHAQPQPTSPRKPQCWVWLVPHTLVSWLRGSENCGIQEAPPQSPLSPDTAGGCVALRPARPCDCQLAFLSSTILLVLHTSLVPRCLDYCSHTTSAGSCLAYVNLF